MHELVIKSRIKLGLLLFILTLFNNQLASKTLIFDRVQQQNIIVGNVSYILDNSPLIGVNVLVKGSTTGEITDIDGNFSIEANPGDILIFSYVGMKTMEQKIIDHNALTIQLEDDAFGLDEIIVSGVASATPRKNLTISVESVDGDKLKEAHSVSAASALQNKVAGLKVVKANGLPGGGASIRLRGSTSLTGNQSPLIMLDGVMISTNLADINLDDIASFEVVKGAAAAALYGSRAGNGVIVLKSKRGAKENEGASTITFRTEVGTQTLANKIELSTHHPYVLAEDWMDYEYTRYDGIFYYNDVAISGSRQVADDAYADQEYARLFDDQELLFQNGLYHTEYVGIEGKERNSNYLVSFENNRQAGILFGTDGYQRNNIKLNLDKNINKKLKLTTSNLLMKATSKNPASYKSFNDVLFISPDVDLTALNSDSTAYKILPDEWGIAENPLYPLYYRDKTAKRSSLIGNIKLDYYLSDWISLDANYTYEYRNKLWTTLTPKGYKVNNNQNAGGTLYKASYNEFNQNFQTTVNLNKQFGDFTSKAKLSYLYENSYYEYFEVLGKDFVFDDIPHLNNTNPELTSMESYEGNIVSINYFAITDLDYKDKYLFSGLFRMDGSSLFGENVRWNPYYRLSAAYRLTEDLKIPSVDEMKLRVSYGTSGQRPGFSNQYETWSISGGQASKQSVGNKDLKPSTTKELEFALHLDFLKKFSLETAYAKSTTVNAIAQAPIPSHYGGFPYQWQNVGTLEGVAIELHLKMNIINTKNFAWNGNIIFDRIRQKIVKLNIPEYKTGPKNAFFIAEGETFGSIYGYKWLRSLDEMEKQLAEGESLSDYELNSDGFIIPAGSEGTVNEIPVILDADNDGLADKVLIGDGNPKFNLSLGNTLKFKGLSLYFLLAWKNGGDIYNYTRQYTFRDLRAIEFDQAGKAEDDKKTINYYSTFYRNTEINDYFIEDASYLKLRELSLSFELPKHFMQLASRNFVKNVRIGIQARNLLTFTEYKGYDPEVSSGSDLTNYPFDNFGYPNFRTYSASLKIIF